MKKYHDTQSVHKWPEDDHIICRNIEPHFMMQYTTNISGDNLKLFYDLYKHNWLSKVKKKKHTNEVKTRLSVMVGVISLSSSTNQTLCPYPKSVNSTNTLKRNKEDGKVEERRKD